MRKTTHVKLQRDPFAALRKRAVFIAVVIHLSLVQTALAELTATIDRQEVANNETLTLLVAYEGIIDTNALDASALAQDFEVLGISPKSAVQIINGVQDGQTSWQISLMPRRTGTLTIPALTVDGETTDPITVTVTQPPTNAATGADFEVTLEADRTQALVGEQIKITVRVLASDQIIGLGRYELSLPGVDLEQLAQNQFGRQIGGRSYTVIELVYAMFATEPGDLVIPAQRLDASKNTGRRDFFGRGQRISAKTDPLTITINPAKTEHPWFAAANVSIEAQLKNATQTLTVGEPFTRNVIVTAQGQFAAAIPPLTFDKSPDFKHYDDQPQLNDKAGKDGVVGMRTESHALVPTVAGSLTLPEMIVHWWDINNSQWRQAVLPAETIQVQPGSGQPTDSSSNDMTTLQEPSTLTDTQVDVVPSAQLHNQDQLRFDKTLGWIALAIGCGLLALCGWLGIENRRLKKRLAGTQMLAPATKGAANESHLWQQVQHAVKQKNPRAVHSAILQWAQTATNNQSHSGLRTLAAKVNDEKLSALIDEFDKALFGGTDAGGTDSHDANYNVGNDPHRQSQIASDVVARLSHWRTSKMAGRTGNRQQSKHSASSLPALYPERASA